MANKKLGPLAWVAIGCLALLVLAGIGFTTCTWFVGKKVTEFGKEMAENPAKGVEWIIKANPDLELVETHEDGRLTIREKETGKVITVDWSDIQSGNFTFESEEGKVEISATEGAVTVRDADGGEEVVYGTGADQNVPDWVPVAEGVEPQVLMSAPGSGLYTAETAVDFKTLGGFYRQRMEAAGYELTVTESPQAITLHGSHQGRTLAVSVTPNEGRGSTVRVNWDG